MVRCWFSATLVITTDRAPCALLKEKPDMRPTATFLSLLGLAFAFTARAVATDATCQPVYDSAAKIYSIPTHSYSTETSSGAKTHIAETIYVNGVIYVLLDSKWIHSKATPQAMLEQQQENVRNAKTSCHYVRAESVNGEAAAMYVVESENEGVKSAAQIWISKSKGLLLKSEDDVDTGDGDKQHMSVHYEYDNVHPPAGVQ
jgi:hypothetical protein